MNKALFCVGWEASGYWFPSSAFWIHTRNPVILAKTVNNYLIAAWKKKRRASTHITSQCFWLLVLSVLSGKDQLLFLPISHSLLPLQAGSALGLCWTINRSCERGRGAQQGQEGLTPPPEVTSEAWQQELPFIRGSLLQIAVQKAATY